MSLSPDTSEATVTERDAVMRERKAFERGALHHDENCASECAKNCFPLPKVERPRTERDYYQREWQLRDAGAGEKELWYRDAKGSPFYCAEWKRASDEKWLLGTRILVAIASLVAQPNELVEDE